MQFWLIRSTFPHDRLTHTDSLPMPAYNEQDWTGFRSSVALKKYLRERDETLPLETLGIMLDQISRFIWKMEVGDIVLVYITPEKGKPHIHFAEVTGKAAYIDGIHRLPVRWFKKTGNALAFRTYKRMLAAATVWPEIIEEKQLKQVVRRQLSLPGNGRFAKWGWLIGAVFLIKGFEYAVRMFE